MLKSLLAFALCAIASIGMMAQSNDTIRIDGRVSGTPIPYKPIFKQ